MDNLETEDVLSSEKEKQLGLQKPNEPNGSSPLVIGIGASAGGLEACRKLIKNITCDTGCIVLCQHLSPTHESKLCEILARDTLLKVRQLQNEDQVKPGYLYVAPPNADLEIRGNTFHLSHPQKGPYPKPNINRFFKSLAENSGERAIAIILSGTGTDGAVGVTTIRGRGGVVMVQDPELASYDGMPNAAIATHMVDFLGSAELIGLQIDKIVKNGQLEKKSIFDRQDEVYDKILRTISEETHVDFSRYKQTTIKRRIARRIAIKGMSSLEEYLKLLQENTEESWSFTQEAFIVVSEFYRDVVEFDFFKSQVLEGLQKTPKQESLRIWVAGCATGDEAYTIAMLLEDIKKQENLFFEYKIFATDISDKAITFARTARYTIDKLVNVPDDWFSYYFERVGEDYEVCRYVREKVVFSVHNIFSDPPFSSIDIVTCRNLLIYFDAHLQTQLIQLFHYSLQEDGLLFLGGAESIQEKDYFLPLNHKQKVYRKLENKSSKGAISQVQVLRKKSEFNGSIVQRKKFDEEIDILKALNSKFMPPTIVINESNKMVFSQGEYMDLLTEKDGFISHDLFEMMLPSLRIECKALVFRVRQSKGAEKGSKQQIIADGKAIEIYLSARLLSSSYPDWVCISFYRSPESSSENVAVNAALSGYDDPTILEIEQELTATRENLQTVIEELETANEQLQLYNEELQSSNEEYQSTNEELQTVNEELQSTNEELLTVNEEYATKTLQQSRLSSDLSNIQESIDIPFFLINKEFRIQRFTRSCATLVDLNKIKVDDIFFAIEWYAELPNFKNLIEAVKENQATERIDIEISDRFYQCQISPYFNAQHEFDGYTIIFYDTTDFEKTKLRLNMEKQSAQVTLETIMEGVIRTNRELEIEYANPYAADTLERDQDDLVGKKIARRLRIFNEDGEEFDVAGTIENCIVCNENYHMGTQPLILKTQVGKDIYIDVSIAPVVLETGVSGGVIAFRDVSERHEQLKRLEWQSQHDALTGLVNRNEMENRLERAIMSAKRDDVESTLLYLDLDQFKVINDTCGHLAGDALLKQLSHLMKEMLRSRDTLARLGGDEFALILDRCSVLDAKGIAEKLQKKIQSYRFAWKDKIFRVGVSIGIASINRNVGQIAEILSDSDAACYAAKESGRNTIQIHSKDDKLLETQRTQMRTIADINEAIEGNDFRVYFHEVHQISDHSLHSWEVLIRMFNKKGEFLLPDSFLPAAERFGLINRIDIWVLEYTLKEISNYFKLDKEELDNIKIFPKININLSAHTIVDESYLDAFSSLTQRLGVPAENITFEITETAAVSNLVKARHFMSRAKTMGCKFALDDFGTGMSSLAYLRELPIDVVKIDKSFIDNICDDPVKFAIVKSVNEVAHLLNLLVIAEGVETKEQCLCLEDLGIDAVQGYFVDKPIPFEQFVARSALA